MACDFQFDVSTDSRGVVLKLSGELDIASTSALETVFQDAENSARMIVDLSGLEFIDSTGLGLLFNAHQRFRDDGKQLVLVGCNGQVRRLLELTGLSEQLTIVQGMDEISSDV